MKWTIYISLILVMATSACSHQGQQMAYGRKDSTAVVKKLYEASQRLYEEQEADSALSILLTATDYAKGCHDPEIRYLIYKDLSGAYEKKDLFDLQEKYLLLQLEAAQSMSDAGKTATSLFTLGVSYYAQGDNEKAIAYLDDAYHKAPSDSTKLRAKCQLMRCQVFLQTETLDSVVSSLHQARAEHPSIAEEEVYHLSEIYMLSQTGLYDEAEKKINGYLQTDSLYARIEELSLLQSIHEKRGQTRQALDDANQLLVLNDSAMQREASTSMAKIHQLQHEEQMKLAAARQEMMRAKSHARIWSLLSLLTIVVAGAIVAIVMFHRKAVVAHQAELDALRLAEDAQSNETEIKALNEDLQRRYYEHLYAILLPILNAKRSPSGHINLNEKSWQLIEENTNLVLPKFTSQLRKNHSSLCDEDVRFCCLVAMKVPNPVIANIYGIAPSSVAIRKLRMKKKLEESEMNETLEVYLTKYGV